MNSETVLYFAYGSNMSSRRMRDRLPDAEPMGKARLSGYGLHFHKRGMDGSAKCNALIRLDGSGLMYGAVYRISMPDKARLDAIEGLDRGYRDVWIRVALQEERRKVTALTYLATHIDGRLKPYSWYLEHVIAGAHEWRLPFGYVSRIEAMETIEDPDAKRAARERTVHEPGNRL